MICRKSSFIKKTIIFLITLSLIILFFSFKKYFFAESTAFLKPNLAITTRVLTNSEFTSSFKSFNYFKNRDTRDKYKALLLTVENKSDKEFILYRNGIDLKLVKPEKIEKNLKFEDFVAPMIASGLISTSFIFYFGFAYVPTVLASIAGGATVNDLLKVQDKNAQLKSSIFSKSFDLLHGILIPAKETIGTLLFVKKRDLKDSFAVKLINKTDNRIETI